MRVIPIAAIDDPRVAPFRHVPDPIRVRDQGVCIAEGRVVVRQVLGADAFHVQALLVTETALRALEGALAGLAEPPPVYVASRALLREIGGFDFHQGCLGLVERPPLADIGSVIRAVEAPRPVIVLEQVGNPDNIGGIFRNAGGVRRRGCSVESRVQRPLVPKGDTNVDWYDAIGPVRGRR